MKRFIDEIAQGRRYDTSKLEGYTEEEVGKMEELLHLEFPEDFRCFLLQIGRCDGGLVGEDALNMYKPGMGIGGFLSGQWYLLEITLQGNGESTNIKTTKKIGNFYQLSTRGVFTFFSNENDCTYFFTTKKEDIGNVYMHNENDDSITDLEMSFTDYMKDCVRRFGTRNPFAELTITRGDMLRI